MIEESDWQAAYRRMIAERQERVGDPPTAEEVEALLNGQLADEDAARVRTLLAYYPEIARVMIEPAPPEDVRVLTDEERAADLAAIRKRITRPVSVPPRRRLAPALAYAAALVVVGGIATFAYMATKHPGPHGNEPAHVIPNAVIDIWPDSVTRGPGAPPSATLHANGKPFVLRLLTNDDRHYDSYRVDVVKADAPQEALWRGSDLTPSQGGSFTVIVPQSALAPGSRYQLILYGFSGTKADVVATYTVIVLA